jgi:branched-chain amino acid transport system ATP-binding protein
VDVHAQTPQQAQGAVVGAPILAARELGVSYGGVHALHDLSVTVDRGQIVGLIGPNGAGKTTTIDALTGFVAHRGRVVVGDRDVTEAPPHARAAAGLARTWQSLELFDDLTVAENCTVAAVRPSLRGALADVVRPSRSRRVDDQDPVRDALALLGIGACADRWPGELSLGQRKLVAVARALSASPSVLLLDEPAAGLDSDESLELGRRLRTLTDHGLSIFLVDHDMTLVLGLCDRVYVLDFGRLIAEGPPASIRSDARVIEAYLGRSAS